MNQSTRCRRPRNFSPAGKAHSVKLELEAPPFIGKRRSKGARAAGVRYERKAQEMLRRRFAETYVASPWFSFLNGSNEKRKYCQPDGLIIDIPHNRIIIVEIKLKHTDLAWWQTRHLYEPVIRAKLGGDWDYSIVELVRWYDPATMFPERHMMLEEITAVKPGRFGVHIWRENSSD